MSIFRQSILAEVGIIKDDSHITDGYIEGFSLPVSTFNILYEKGAIVPTHYHDKAQLIRFLDGNAIIETDERVWTLSSNSIFWLPPYVKHKMTLQKSSLVQAIYIDTFCPSDYCSSEGLTARIVISQLVESSLDVIRCAGNNYKNIDSFQRLSHVVIDEILGEFSHFNSLENIRSKMLTYAYDIVVEDLEKRQTLDSISSRLNVSAKTLSRAIKKETGFTFKDWHRNILMEFGKIKLKNGAQVTLTASQLGYKNTSQFISAFKEVVGMTPKKYQQRFLFSE
nr:helix-turn-helix domain-containing protein [Halomonas socia]